MNLGTLLSAATSALPGGGSLPGLFQNTKVSTNQTNNVSALVSSSISNVMGGGSAGSTTGSQRTDQTAQAGDAGAGVTSGLSLGDAPKLNDLVNKVLPWALVGGAVFAAIWGISRLFSRKGK